MRTKRVFIGLLLVTTLVFIYLFRIELLSLLTAGKNYYLSCRCCCPNTKSEACLYFFKGDRIGKIIASDKKGSTDCSLFGCTPAIEYRYCDLDFLTK